MAFAGGSSREGELCAFRDHIDVGKRLKHLKTCLCLKKSSNDVIFNVKDEAEDISSTMGIIYCCAILVTLYWLYFRFLSGLSVCLFI